MSLKPSAMKWVALDLAVVLIVVGVVLWIHPWGTDTATTKSAGGPAVKFNAELATKGKALAGSNGCNSCHTIDGGAGAGPTWKGLFGSTGKRGSKVDDKYISDTLANPPGPMATFKGKFNDDDVKAITEYIKSLAQ